MDLEVRKQEVCDAFQPKYLEINEALRLNEMELINSEQLENEAESQQIWLDEQLRILSDKLDEHYEDKQDLDYMKQELLDLDAEVNNEIEQYNKALVKCNSLRLDIL